MEGTLEMRSALRKWPSCAGKLRNPLRLCRDPYNVPPIKPLRATGGARLPIESLVQPSALLFSGTKFLTAVGVQKVGFVKTAQLIRGIS